MITKGKSVLLGLFFYTLIAMITCFGTTVLAAETDAADGGAGAESTVNAIDSDLVLNAKDGWFNSTAAGIAKDKITKVIFSDSVPAGYTASWDASASGNGGVMAYLVGTEVTIVGDGTGKIYANSNSRWMFYDFKKLTIIENMGMLDTGNVTTMSGMFDGCSGLTELDVSGFDTGNVTDMSDMFRGCSGLTELDVSGFDTGNVKSMGYMFSHCSGLTELDVSGFDTGNVTNMYGMFWHCSGLTELDVSGFDTGNVKSMGYMFSYCSGLTELDVSGFDTGNVTGMSGMFYGCSGLTELDVSGFATGNVTTMSGMFYGCSGLTELDVSGFATGNVTTMWCMFWNCSGLTELDVSGFATGNVTTMSGMFYGCSGLTELDVSGFATGNVTTIWGMFWNCSGLTELDVSGFATGNVTDMEYMFSGCSGLRSLDVSGFSTGNVKNMGCMFYECENLTELDVSGFDTGNVKGLYRMFENCRNLRSLDVSGFATGNVTEMYRMFEGCQSLNEIDVSGFATGNVTSMYGMFWNCSGLTELDVSGFATGNVTSMGHMFNGCSGLTELDVSGFATGNVTSMYGMFNDCSGLTELDVSGFATGNVTSMGYMFNGCSGLTELDLSGFDTKNVTEMLCMFSGCDSLKSIMAGEGYTMALESSYFSSGFYSGNNLSGGNGEKYTYLNLKDAKPAAVFDCHGTPGFLTYNGADKCVVTYDLNYEGAPKVDFTQQVKQGKSITIGGAAGQVPNPTRTDYEFLGWGTSPKATVVYKAGDGVPTDSGSMTLYAQWRRTRCTVTIDWQDGEDIRPNTKTTMDVFYGKTPDAITVPVVRDKYVFRGIYSEPNGLGKLYVNEDGTWYRAWDGTEDTTLYAFWSRKDRVDYFWDVLRTDWFYDDVYFMYDRGLMLGIGNSTTFGPGESLTRSQFVTILYRMAHSPAGVEYEAKFPDVPEGEWFAIPVMWAYNNGIVKGYGTGWFGPADAITREQLAVMLYNYVSWKGGFDMTGRADLSGFEDADSVSDWAYDAVSWAVAEGIISGKGGTRLDPQGITARCECSAMVQRYCDEAK